MFDQLSPTQWIAVLSSVLLVVSEVLPFSSKIKANGIFQGLLSLLGLLKGK